MPHLRFEVASGRRLLLRQQGRVVLLGKVHRWSYGVHVYRTGGYLSPLPALRADHPVVVVDGVGLHQRDDHEAAAVGQGTDFQGYPRDRELHTAAEPGRGQQRQREFGCGVGLVVSDLLGDGLGQAAGEQDHLRPGWEVRQDAVILRSPCIRGIPSPCP